MKKLIAIVLCSIALLSATVISTYAKPSQPPNTNWQSGTSGPLLTYEYTQNLVRVCEAQYNLSSPQYYVSFSSLSNRRSHSTLICLTREYQPNYGGYGRYFAYVAFTTGDATNVGVNLIPEEWGQPGASLPITFTTSSGNGSVGGYLKLQFYPGENGGFYPVGVFAASTITLVNNQYNTEQVVYLYSGAGVGYNDLYTTYGSNQYSSTIDKWIEAYFGYENGVGATPEELESAYDDGYVEGYQEGSQYGYTNGYANGYEVGRSDGYESGYDNGYDIGLEDGSPIELNVPGIITAVPEGAKAIIDGAFGFEIFGINVAGTLTALLVVAIVAFVVKKLMTR